MIRIVLVLAAVFLLWRVWREMTQRGDLASRERWRKRGLYVLGGVLIGLGVWLAATGRFHAAWIGLLGVFAWLRRGMFFFNMFQRLGGGSGEGAGEGVRGRFDSFFRAQGAKQGAKKGGSQGGGRAKSSNTMTRRQAAGLLGVSVGASKEEITQAFRQKMRAAHPDVGGDKKLASQLNAARDTLLSG